MPLVFLFPPSLGQITASARAELLSEWLGSRLGNPVRVELADTYAELQARITARDVDLAWAPPSICARVAPGVRKIFKAIRRGTADYHAALIVRTGTIESPQQLAGKRAAWVDQLSTAGYLLPAAYLRHHGLGPDSLKSQSFLGSYAEAIRAVLASQADVCSVFVHVPTDEACASALSGIVGDARAQRLSPLAYTDPAPSDGLVVPEPRAGADAEVDLARLAELVGYTGNTSMLHSLLEADHLVPAEADDYASLL